MKSAPGVEARVLTRTFGSSTFQSSTFEKETVERRASNTPTIGETIEPSPYEAYYLEQAAKLEIPDAAAPARPRRGDFSPARLTRGAAAEESRSLGGLDVAKLVIGVIVLVVVPLAIAALYWRTSTFG